MPKNFLKKPITALFQKRVYKIVRQIPRGKVMTYKEVAQKSDSPQAWRAVGNALNKNINFEIPCHRVIKSNEKIGGYNKGKKLKLNLLRKEGLNF